MVLLMIWTIMIGLGLVFPKSRYVALTQILFVVLMMATNTENPDYPNYLRLFNNLVSNPSLVFTGNIGTNFLLYVTGLFHSFPFSLFVLASMGMFLMYKGVLYYTESIAYVFSLYLISPFTIDATQIKNFVAMSIWIYFSRFLFEANQNNRKTYNIVLYLLGVIICSSIHYSFLFTALFVFSTFLQKRNSFIRGGLVIAVSVVFIENFDSLISMISNRSNFMFDLINEKRDLYDVVYNETNTQTRLELTLIFYVIIIVLMIILYQYIRTKRSSDFNSIGYFGFMCKLFMISLLILPLMNYSMEMYRIQRNLLVPLYILIAMLLPDTAYRKPVIILSEPYFLGIFISFFYLYADTLKGNVGAVFRTLFRFYY